MYEAFKSQNYFTEGCFTDVSAYSLILSIGVHAGQKLVYLNRWIIDLGLILVALLHLIITIDYT